MEKCRAVGPELDVRLRHMRVGVQDSSFCMKKEKMRSEYLGQNFRCTKHAKPDHANPTKPDQDHAKI